MCVVSMCVHILYYYKVRMKNTTSASKNQQWGSRSNLRLYSRSMIPHTGLQKHNP